MTDRWTVLADGISFGESPRWRDGRLWFCDWGAQALVAVDLDGRRELIAHVPSFPFCIAWHPDGRLLVTNAARGTLDSIAGDGTLHTVADLTTVSDRPPGNEVVVDGAGHIYVDGGGFDMMAGEPVAPGMIALVGDDGSVRRVADGLAFPNGMAVTPDGSTLICAESHGHRLTAFEIASDGGLGEPRTWAEMPGSAPDGICLDAEGAVWYADVPHRRCVRVREGGEILDTVTADRGCFSCALGGPGGTTLFAVARQWHGSEGLAAGEGTGQILTTTVTVPAA